VTNYRCPVYAPYNVRAKVAILAADVAPLHLSNRWLKIYRLPFFSPFKDIKKRAAYYI
jgi:hypothetical protein